MGRDVLQGRSRCLLSPFLFLFEDHYYYFYYYYLDSLADDPADGIDGFTNGSTDDIYHIYYYYSDSLADFGGFYYYSDSPADFGGFTNGLTDDIDGLTNGLTDMQLGQPMIHFEMAMDGIRNCDRWFSMKDYFALKIVRSVFRSGSVKILDFQLPVSNTSKHYLYARNFANTPGGRPDMCPTAWATESLTVSTSNSVGRQVRAEEAILRSFVHSSHGRRLADAIVQNVTVSATRNLRSSRDFICSFDIVPGLALTEVKTFLNSKIGEIVPKFNAMTSSGVTASDCSMLPDEGQSLRLKCSVTTEPRGRLFAGFEDFRSTLKVAVSSRVLDVSVNLLYGEGTKPLEISLGLNPSLQASLGLHVGALCDTFLSHKSAWDRMWQELQHEYTLVGSQDAAVCTQAQ